MLEVYRAAAASGSDRVRRREHRGPVPAARSARLPAAGRRATRTPCSPSSWAVAAVAVVYLFVLHTVYQHQIAPAFSYLQLHLPRPRIRCTTGSRSLWWSRWR